MSPPNPTYKLYVILAFAVMLAITVKGSIGPSLLDAIPIEAGQDAAYGGPGELSEDSFEVVGPSLGEIDLLSSAAFESLGGLEMAAEAGAGSVNADAASSDEEEETAKPGLKIFEHTVASGESLWVIAKNYGIEVDTILAANDLPNAHDLRVGQTLKVPNMDGALHQVQTGESIWEIAKEYRVDSSKIIEVNGLEDPSRLQVKQELFIPGGQAVAANRGRLISRNGQLQRAFEWPVTTGWISSRFGPRWGKMHEGLDIAVNTGTPVRASAGGRVKFSGSKGGYGLLVIIDHGNGIETRYAHNSRLLVRAGQTVAKGQVIAKSGDTGNSTGPHVHFEIRLNGRAYDPLKYLVPR